MFDDLCDEMRKRFSFPGLEQFNDSGSFNRCEIRHYADQVDIKHRAFEYLTRIIGVNKAADYVPYKYSTYNAFG